MKCLLLFTVMFSIALSACAGAPAPTATPVPTKVPSRRVALVMKTLTNPFFIEMEKGARHAEKELGIELIVKTAAQETSIEQQVEIINQLTSDKVDAIVIAPGDSRELIPALKKAQAAGIKIVNVDNKLDVDFSKSQGLTDVPYISVDNQNGGYLSAKFISDQIKAPTNAVVLEGIQTAQNAEDRKNGAVKAFQENKNITIVDSQTANWKIDEAYTVTKALFTKHPDVKAVFAANDMMALGAIQYLQDAKKTDVLVAGYDALDDAKKAIKAGTLMVTIDQQAGEQGYTGVKYAVRALNGEKLPPETMVDVFVVNKDNVK